MLNDVSAAFSGWLQPITVTSFAPGTYVAGNYVAGVGTDRTIKCVVQNASPDDLEVIPEGMRTQETLKVHTIAVLKPVSEANSELADLITYDGFKWRVHSVADRKIGKYYKAIAIRESN